MHQKAPLNRGQYPGPVHTSFVAVQFCNMHNSLRLTPRGWALPASGVLCNGPGDQIQLPYLPRSAPYKRLTLLTGILDAL
jgi:hypothetical protein